MRNRTLILILALAFAAPAQAADRLTVLLDWYVNADHGPLIVAKQKGYFAEAGLDVTLTAPADPNDPPKLVAAGQADIGVSYQPQLHFQVNEDLPLVRIGTLIATPLTCLLVRADSGIATLADLKGKQVGYSVGGLEDALVGIMLRGHGLTIDDIQLVNVNFALTPALLSRQVDAAMGAFRNVELVQMGLEGVPGRCFDLEEEGVPPYDELIYIANRDRLDRPELRRFLDAVERATLFIANHPDEGFDLFKSFSPELDDDLSRRSWQATWPRFAPSPAALDSHRYARFASFLHELGLIGDPPPVSTYAVDLGAR